MPPDLKLTSETFWQSTVLFGAIDLVLLSPLVRLIKRDTYLQLRWAVVVASALLWGVFSTLLISGFWDSYYRYFFPEHMRALAPLYAFLYAAIGFVLWWLGARIPGNPVVNFCLLAACESVLEHLWGIYGFGILRIPTFENVSPLSILVFSFVEYILYWGTVMGIAALVQIVWQRRMRMRKRQARASF